MTDELVVAVAVAVTKGAIDGLTEGGRAAFAALVRVVRRKLGDSSASVLADDADPARSDEARVAALRLALETELAQDPAFAAGVARLWAEVDAQRLAGEGNVTNQISGSVAGNAVQARDVQGGISFG